MRHPVPDVLGGAAYGRRKPPLSGDRNENTEEESHPI